MSQLPKTETLMLIYAVIYTTLVLHCHGVSFDDIMEQAYEEQGQRADHPMGWDANQTDVRVQYDMKFTLKDYNNIQRLSIYENETVEETESRKKRKAINEEDKRWPGATIPYGIAPEFSSSEVAVLQNAMRHWMSNTCLTFRARLLTDKYFIFFKTGTGCWSHVGRQTDTQQTIELSPPCVQEQVVIHEIGHAIGFYHEHSRPDRDDFIKIHPENIRPNSEHNFDKWLNVNALKVGFDYKSIMHYSGKAWTVNGEPTIRTTDTSMQDVIGNSKGLSAKDIELANRMYNCKTCGGHFDTPTGSFTSPNFPNEYPKKSDCTWVIRVRTGPIVLSFTSFELEGCDFVYDSLYVYDGDSFSAGMIRRLCGIDIPGPVNSTGNTMLIHFLSDGSIEKKGFQASYTTPGAPVDIGASWSQWSNWGGCSVTCGSGTRQRTRQCQGGRCDGLGTQRQACQRNPCDTWGGWTGWSTCTATCGGGTIKRSRSCIPRNGNCRGLPSQTRNCAADRCPEWDPWRPWTVCSVSCGGGLQRRTRACNPPNGNCGSQTQQTLTCNTNPCRPPVGVGGTPCNKLLTAGSGIITSPNYPADYSSNSNCSWRLQVPSGPIKLSFVEFVLEDCSDSITKRSNWDYVNVYDGITSSSRSLLHMCGDYSGEPLKTVKSSGNTMLITFISDGNINYRGFHISYQSLNGWGEWGAWGACSKSCDSGSRRRTRTCPRGSTCNGENGQFGTCNHRSCGLPSTDLMNCNFERPCDALTSIETGPFKWVRNQGPTESQYTGPEKDHTLNTAQGHFMYNEASYAIENAIGLLQTDPPMRHSNNQACVRFWYHMKGASMGSLEVNLKQGSSSSTVWSKSGNQGSLWNEAAVTANTPINQDFTVEFKATRGALYTGDSCIDDVVIQSGSCTT